MNNKLNPQSIFEDETTRASLHWTDYQLRSPAGGLTGHEFKLLWLNQFLPIHELAVMRKIPVKTLTRQMARIQRKRDGHPYTEYFIRRYALNNGRNFMFKDGTLAESLLDPQYQEPDDESIERNEIRKRAKIAEQNEY